MNIPFSLDQFLSIFAAYNLTVWPMQIVMYVLAFIVLILAAKHSKFSDSIIMGILAFFWFWVGIVYHWMFFSDINRLAYFFGSLFVIQGALFVYYGIRDKLTFTTKTDVIGLFGFFFILYALLVYPGLNIYFDHAWPFNPTFGLPCPVTIFTFGLLLWTTSRVPKALLVIPFTWALVGVSAAFQLGIWEDTVLVVAGLVATLLIYMRDRQ